MDQVFQLQQQIQRLQQEVNDIYQVCNQLQQSEQSNALQLQQMTQKELLASQGIRRIQQAAGQLSQEINRISGIAQQIVNQVSPFQRTFQGTGTLTGTYGTGLAGQAGAFYPQTGTGAYYAQPGTGLTGGAQYGAFGQGITPQIGLTNLANMGVSPSWVSNLPSMLHPYSQGYIANQFGTGTQSGYSAQAFASPMASQFGNFQQGTGQALSGYGAGLGQTALTGAAGQMGMMNITPGQQATFGGTQTYGSSQGLAGFTGNRGIPASQLLDVMSTTMGLGTNPASSFQIMPGQAWASPAGYSPYQANQFGFR
ncbi:MAG: hypothetical protein K6T66_01850 [Peptococcaceae bacterium]|nr:hypothetical protein [Peptococcaceae bacterium]